MTFIEGIGDEVTACFVIFFVIVLAGIVTLTRSGPHLYSPVHTRAVTISLVSSREQAEDIAVQSPNTSPPRTNISPPFEQLIVDFQSAPTNRNRQEPVVRATNASVEDTEDPRVTDDTDDPSSSDETQENVPTTVTPTAPSEQDVAQDAPNVARDTPNVAQEPANVARDTPNVARDSLGSDAQGIRVRLKYLDDTERTVRSSPVVKIGDFKRNHFPDDLASNKVVRLIFSGHLLRDNSTLQAYRVTDNSVLHVQVLPAQGPGVDRGARSHAGQQGAAQELLDLSHLLWPLVTLILGICWACYIKYPEFFSVISLSLLFVFTASFFVFYRHVHQ